MPSDIVAVDFYIAIDGDTEKIGLRREDDSVLEVYIGHFDESGGSGLPDGGTTGQILRKASNADGNATWQSIVSAWISDLDSHIQGVGDPRYAPLSGGFIDDANIPAGITRDSELTSAITTALNDLIDGAPGALNTLNELAAAVNDDQNFAATVTTALSDKAAIDGSNVVAATWRTALGLGTAATQNKVSAGTAGVLDAQDPTTTNSRTPTAHAASHAAAGTDPVTITEAQVTGLVADLAAKETPAGAQAKADAKVEDQIVDAVTTKAPSQNAVFDALAANLPVSLLNLGTAKSINRQGVPPIWASGTFTAKRTTVRLMVEGQGRTLGAAWGALLLCTGVNGGLPNSRLASVAAPYAAAAGVTEYQLDLLVQVEPENIIPFRRSILLTGLTIGRVYTWQILAGNEGSIQEVAVAPASGLVSAVAVASDDASVWISYGGASGGVSWHPIGMRPGWKYAGLSQNIFGLGAGTNIATGTGALGLSAKAGILAVGNLSASTVTFINTVTKAVIGTTASLGSNVYSVELDATATICYAGCADGKVYPITVATRAVGTGIQVLTAAHICWGMALNNAGTILWVNDYGTANIYPLTLPGTVGSPVVLSGTTVGSCCRASNDGTGDVFVTAANGKIYRIHAGAATVVYDTTYTTLNDLWVTPDGVDLWWTTTGTHGGFVEAATGILLGVWTFPGAATGSGLAGTSDSYVIYSERGTVKALIFPGAVTSITPGIGIPGGYLTVSVEGAS